MPVPTTAKLPPASLVLVTGVNGYVGCQVANQLLAYGFHVRGTVRDPTKNAWIREHFDKEYGAGKFELVEVKDLGAKTALDAAVKGCDGIIHVASNVTFNPDPNIVVNEAVTFTLNALESAIKEQSVKRFVLTSSSAAANQMKLNEPYDLTADSWNTESVEEAWKPEPYGPKQMLYCYNASKVQSEQALWKFMKERKPQFMANAVLPDFVTGLPVDLEKQGYGPSCGCLKALWDGDDFWRILGPHYMIDAKDCARLHVAALIHPELENERIFGYAHYKTWTDWIRRLRRMYPQHTFPDPPEDEGDDLATIVGQKKAESLLIWLGRDGWRPMEDSIKEVVDTMA